MAMSIASVVSLKHHKLFVRVESRKRNFLQCQANKVFTLTQLRQLFRRIFIKNPRDPIVKTVQMIVMTQLFYSLRIYIFAVLGNVTSLAKQMDGIGRKTRRAVCSTHPQFHKQEACSVG